MRILVVDDDPVWRKALSTMYEQVLRSGGHTINVAANPSDAIRALKQCRYDVLSLDINLSRNSATDEAGRPIDANGMDVLDYTHRSNRAEAVIVISGCSWDRELTQVICDAGEEVEVRANMEGLLSRMFGRRCRFFPKPDPSTVCIDATLAVWQSVITSNFLDILVRGSLLPPPYCLEINVSSGLVAETIAVISKSSKERVEINERNDVDFIWSLVLQWQDDAKGVSHEEAARALLGPEEARRRLSKYGNSGEYTNRDEKWRHEMMQRTVHGYVEVFKKRLRNLRVDPEYILQSWRSPSGWRLMPGIGISAGSDLSKRSAGHGRGAFDPVTTVPAREATADSIVADLEVQDVAKRFLAVADSEESETFSGLSTDMQETILELFARHERRWKKQK